MTDTSIVPVRLEQLRAGSSPGPLRATVSTFPKSGYDLEELLTQLGTGEALVTVLSDPGAPMPVAWTRMRAPQSRMAPSDPELPDQIEKGSDAALDRVGDLLDEPTGGEYAEKIETGRSELDARVGDDPHDARDPRS